MLELQVFTATYLHLLTLLIYIFQQTHLLAQIMMGMEAVRGDLHITNPPYRTICCLRPYFKKPASVSALSISAFCTFDFKP